MRGRVASERFVGREGELEILEADSGAVVITGDAGVGKSRLIAELEGRAMADGKFVLVGECLQLTDGELPYAAVVSALRPMLHDDVAADVFTAGERQQLLRLWPELGGEGEAGSEADHSNQARVFALLLRLLAALARRRPVWWPRGCPVSLTIASSSCSSSRTSIGPTARRATSSSSWSARHGGSASCRSPRFVSTSFLESTRCGASSPSSRVCAGCAECSSRRSPPKS